MKNGTVKIKITNLAYIRLPKDGSLYKIASNYEEVVAEYLILHDIRFVSQCIFIGCNGSNPLPFDFYIPKYNLIIEVDGKQHYKKIDYFGNNSSYKKQKEHDAIKENYCKKHKIKIKRINYSIFTDNKNCFKNKKLFDLLDKTFEKIKPRKEKVPDWYYDFYKNVCLNNIFMFSYYWFVNFLARQGYFSIGDSLNKKVFNYDKQNVLSDIKILQSFYQSNWSNYVRNKSHVGGQIGGKKSKVKDWLDTLNEDDLKQVKQDVLDLSRNKFKAKWNHDRRAVENNLDI